MRHPLVRVGLYAWAVVGIAVAAVVAGLVVGQLRLVVVPLVLALFPAALVAPLRRLLERLGLPPAVTAAVLLFGGLGLFVLVGLLLVPPIAAEAPRLAESVRDGIAQVDAFLDTRPFGIDPDLVRERVSDIQSEVDLGRLLRTGVLGAAAAAAEITAVVVLLLVVLFFYLKDGRRIAGWLCRQFPAAARDDVEAMASRAWETIGRYFRGQLLVALFDAVFIGIGLRILGVPLAMPLAVLVFFGGLFPIVGAVVTGGVAVLVALADAGPIVALGALAVVVAVQQLESNVLGPVVLGKATALHPLAVITALTAGGILLGVLGAFLAVPVAASIVRSVGYLRERHSVA